MAAPLAIQFQELAYRQHVETVVHPFREHSLRRVCYTTIECKSPNVPFRTAAIVEMQEVALHDFQRYPDVMLAEAVRQINEAVETLQREWLAYFTGNLWC